jgi:hypothetical protein
LELLLLFRLWTSVAFFHSAFSPYRFDIKGDDNAKKYFEIDTNGALKVKDLPDLETTSMVNFTGNAVQGTPSTSASVSISITITGKNDNRPQFDKKFYNMETVCDYYPVPYALITVGKTSATDRDVSKYYGS